MRAVLMVLLVIGMCAPALGAGEVTKADIAATTYTPAPEAGAPLFVAAEPQDEVKTEDFLSQVFEAAKKFGGLSWAGKVILVITLLISSLKVSLLRSLIWDKLGAAQVLLAPILGLIGGLLSLEKPTAAAVIAWLLAGAGAILLHQLFDALKRVPKIGEKYGKWIDLVSGLLGGKKKQA